MDYAARHPQRRKDSQRTQRDWQIGMWGGEAALLDKEGALCDSDDDVKSAGMLMSFVVSIVLQLTTA